VGSECMRVYTALSELAVFGEGTKPVTALPQLLLRARKAEENPERDRGSRRALSTGAAAVRRLPRPQLKSSCVRACVRRPRLSRARAPALAPPREGQPQVLQDADTRHCRVAQRLLQTRVRSGACA
jgi:hypothetical protein